MARIGLNLTTLVLAAAEIADKQGLEAVTLAYLAQVLKIRSPSLYNHVKGLPELRRQLALFGVSQMKAEFRHVMADKSWEEAIAAFSAAYLAFARAHPGLYEAVQRAAEPDDIQLNEARWELVQLAINSLEGYGLKGDEAIHAVRGLRSMLHGFVSLERQGGFGIKLDLDETFRKLIQTFISGIKAIHTAETEVK